MKINAIGNQNFKGLYVHHWDISAAQGNTQQMWSYRPFEHEPQEEIKKKLSCDGRTFTSTDILGRPTLIVQKVTLGPTINMNYDEYIHSKEKLPS